MVFAAAEVDQVKRLDPAVVAERRMRLRNVSPDDGKYFETVNPLRDYLTPEAEWRAFANVQHAFIQTRHEYGQATAAQVKEVEEALKKIDPLNMALLEEHKDLKHDQLAVIEEIGRYVSPETKALLHPGTTSYDIVDTANALRYRRATEKAVLPRLARTSTVANTGPRSTTATAPWGRSRCHSLRSCPTKSTVFVAGLCGSYLPDEPMPAPHVPAA